MAYIAVFSNVAAVHYCRWSSFTVFTTHVDLITQSTDNNQTHIRGTCCTSCWRVSQSSSCARRHQPASVAAVDWCSRQQSTVCQSTLFFICTCTVNWGTDSLKHVGSEFNFVVTFALFNSEMSETLRNIPIVVLWKYNLDFCVENL